MIDQDRRRRRLFFNIFTALLFLSTVIYLVWSLRPLILPVALGILLAYLFEPLKSAFKYSWLPNSIRVTLLFSVLTGIVLVGTDFIKDNIPNEKEKLEILVRVKYKFNEKFNKIMDIDPKTGKGNALYNYLAQDIAPLKKSLNEFLELSPEQREAFLNYYDGVEGTTPIPEKYYKYYLANANRPRDKVAIKAENEKSNKSTEKAEHGSFILNLVDTISIWFLMPITFIFFLIDDGSIMRFFIRMVPNKYFELTLSLKEEVDDAIGKYLRGISIECGLLGLFLTFGLYLVGIPIKTSLFIGILSGLATAIPFLGPVVGLAFSIAYTLIAEDISSPLPFMNGDSILIAVVVVNILVKVLDDFVFQPIVLGGAVDLHPLVVILGIMGGSMMFGMAGVLLGIPAIVILKVVIETTFRGLKDYRII